MNVFYNINVGKRAAFLCKKIFLYECTKIAVNNWHFNLVKNA